MIGDEEPSLTLNRMARGVIVVLDLDEFGKLVRERGLSEYRPNDITGLLTRVVEEFASRWRGVVVYGLDYDRGTEEAVIEIPYTSAAEVADDLRRIREEVNRAGGRITIVAVDDFVLCRRARSRREAYYGTPGRRRAIRILKKLKRKGGNMVFIG